MSNQELRETIEEIIVHPVQGVITVVTKSEYVVGEEVRSVGYARRAIKPGDDYSNELPKVRLVCELVQSETYLGIPINESPPPAQWDDFTALMLNDIVYQQAVGAVLSTAPGLATALPAALSLVATNGSTGFASVWNNFCTVANISAEQRGEWADAAEGFNLPADFVTAVRGATNEA